MKRIAGRPRRVSWGLGVLAFGLLVACEASENDGGDAGDARGGRAGDSAASDSVVPQDAPVSLDSGVPGDTSDGTGAQGSDGQDVGALTDRGDGGSALGDGDQPNMLPCTNCTLSQWDLAGEQLAYDGQRNRLYVTVAGAASAHGNSLVTIDIADQRLVSAPFIGSNPRALALSDDASTLWVGIDGTFQIRKVNLAATPPALGAPLPVPQENPSFGGPTIAARIVPLPGSPGSAAVMTSAPASRVYVFDDPTPRAMAPQIHGITDLVAGPPGFLFGYNGSSTAYWFFTVTVSPSGVTSSSFSNLLNGFSVRIHHAPGRVFAENGQTVDVTNPTSPVAGPRLALSGRMAVQSATRMLLITNTNATGGSTPWRLAVLNPADTAESNFVNLPSSIFAAPFGETSSVTQLVHAGSGAAAFLVFNPDARFSTTGRTYLYIIKSPILESP